VVSQQNADIANTLQLKDDAMATIFVFLHMGCTLLPPGKYEYDSSMCGCDAALCQITLTTC